MTWIDRDPKLIAKQAAAQQRQRTELDEEQRTRRAIELQIAAAAMRQAEQQQQEQHDESGMENGVDGGDDEVVPGAEYVPSDGATKIGMSLKMADTAKKRPIRSISFDPAVTADEGLEEPVAKRAAVGGNGTFQPSSASSSSSSASSSSSNSLAAPKAAASSSSRPLSAVEQLMQEEEKRKEVQLQLDDKRDRKDYWLHPGIVVKIMSRKLAEGRFYKKKASVLKVIDKYVGEVRVDETGTIVRIDQDDLETVIPKVNLDLQQLAFAFPEFPSFDMRDR
jgi:DNA/RNA-binding protein KIN17